MKQFVKFYLLLFSGLLSAGLTCAQQTTIESSRNADQKQVGSPGNAASLKTGSMTNAIKLKITGAGYYDETIISFINGASEKYDSQFDTYKLFGSSPPVLSIYTVVDSCLALSTNAHDPNIDHEIPFVMKTTIGGMYSLTAEVIGEFDAGITLSLEDTSTGSKKDLLANYTKTFLLKSGGLTCITNYIIHFKSTTVGTPEPIASDDIKIYPNPTRGLLFFEKTNGSNKVTDVEIYNMMGQKVYEEQISFVQNVASVNLQALFKGTYLIVIQTEGSIQTERVQIAH